jgi:beta-galactosidase GanA
MSQDDTAEGYDGHAEVVTETGTVTVEVQVRGFFQPIDGRFHWHGRVAPSAPLDALVGNGGAVVLRTPHGEAPARLADRDPWGRLRVTGIGRPPFPA